MMRRLLALALITLAACGGEKEEAGFAISREPVSVRGWILDVKDAQRGDSMEVEVARRQALFAATSVWVENVEHASGGISENGAFVVLDVPPGNAILGFNAPGAETARIVMEGIPGFADVIIPDVVLENGGAKAFDYTKILIRLPSSNATKPTRTNRTAKIMGYTVPIVETPISQMGDRREYLTLPGYRPVATFK